MALDPLRFAIEIVDDATKKIESIKDAISNLDPKIKVTFDESSINVTQLKTSLENVLKNLGEIKIGGSGINISGDALSGATDKIEAAKDAIKGGRFGELAKRINEATTELERLTVAFQNFHMTVSQDKGLKDFMTGLGEVISNVKTQLGALDKVSNSESSLTKIAEKVETNKRRFNELLESAGKLKTELASVDAKALDLNMDNPSMRNSLKVLNDYIAKLREMRENPGAIDYKSDHQIKELIAQFNRLKTTLTEVSTEQQKLNRSVSAEGARDDANAAKEARQNYEAWVESIRRATVEHTKLAITIAQLEDKERKASGVGVNTKDLKDQIAGLKQYKDTLKEIADGSKQHGLAKDFVRRADVESAIMLAKREGEVVMQNARAREQSDKQMLQNIKQSEDNQQRYNKVLAEAVAMQERLMNAGNKGTSLGLDTSKIDDASIKLQQYIDKLLVLDKTQFGAASRAEWKTLEASLKSAAAALEKLNAATEKQKKKDAEDDRRKQAKENDDWAKSMAKAGEEANKLGIQIRKLQAIQKEGDAVGADTSKLRTYISQLDAYRGILESINQGYKTYGHTGPWLTGQQTLVGVDTLGNTKRLADEASESVKKETRELERNQSEKQKSASATSQLTAEEQRLAQALNQTTEHARGQSQVLSDLKSMAMQYLGVWGGQQFLHNIIEIGGQLEMQRLSIGAILSNQSQANDLFEKIKGLAVQSPFGVVELDQMTKQLTAYGFKYNELFDMTKRLADISAATGTGVDRLALALGHVRSEAALSGYTLRQFSMANVPLLAKLSEKLGKTTQEIRKMVRAKEVSYEDVVGVLKDITNEGGMFYQMQEVISSSVKAKFKNVKDAMDIMYGEMAEGYIGDSLKGVADALMEVTRNWKDAATVLGTGAALWATQRVAAMAYATTLGKTNAAVMSTIAVHRQKEAMMLRDASTYRALSIAELQQLATYKQMTIWEKIRVRLGGQLSLARQRSLGLARDQQVMNMALALSEKKLTTESILRQVAYGKLLKWQAAEIISLADLSAAQRAAALSALRHTEKLKGVSLWAEIMGNGIRKAALALKAFVFNPAMLGMAAITALVELWQRNNAEMERAKELGDAIFEASQEGLKNTRQMMEQTGINAYQARFDKSGEMALKNLTKSFGTEQEREAKTFLVKPEFDPSTAQQIIDEWSQYIRDYAGTPNKMLNDALLDETGNVRMLKDQFDHLFDSVRKVALAQKDLADIVDAMQSAQEATGSGWLNEDLVDDIADYDKALRKYNKSIVLSYHEHSRAIKKGIDAARKADSLFAKNTEGMASYSDMLKELVDNSKSYSRLAGKAFVNAAEENSGILDKLFSYKSSLNLGASAEAEKEFKVFKDNLSVMLEGLGQDIENLSPDMKQGLMSMFINKVLGQDKLGRISKETRDKFIKDFADFIGETVDDAEEVAEKRLADWQKRAGDVFVVNKEIKVQTKTTTDITEFASKVQEDLKKKQEYITKSAGHIRQVLTISTSLKLDTKTLNEQIIALGTQVQVLAARGQTEAARVLNSKIQDELIPFRDALMSIEEDKKWLKKEGYPEKDPTKDKSKNKNKKNEKAYKDPDVEKWKERMRNIREAYREYEKWEKKVGHAEAIARIKREFSGLVDEKTLDDIKNYRKEIEKIRNDAQARYNSQKKDKSKDYGKQAQQLVRDSEKALNEIDLGVFDRAAEKFKSDMERTLSELSRKWEVFTNVRNATGNETTASILAGFGENIPEAKDVAAAFKDYLQTEIAKMGDEVTIPIRFDQSMSKQEVEDMVKAALGGTKYKEQIEAITDGIQKWIELSKDAEKKAVDAYTSAMTKAMDYASQIARINAELAEQNRLIDENKDPNFSQSDRDRAKGINQANASMRILEASDSYKRFFNNVFGETQTELQGMANTIKAQLNDSLKKGAITAEDYAKKIKDIDNVMQQSEISNPEKWYNKGIFNTESMEQRNQRKANEGNELIQKGANLLQEGLNSGDGKLIAEGQKIKEAGQNMVKGANQAALTMAIIDKVVHGVDQSIQGTVKAFDYLKEALDALGIESDTMSTVGDYLHTLGEMSSHVTSSWDNFKSGNFVGASVEAIGAVTSVIKGIAQAHDNRLERAIERLRDDVKSIESNTELIARSRERTLGYDTGDLRRQMAQQYAQPSASGQSGIMAYIASLANGTKQNKSMFDYYSQNSQGTGYQQEYSNLVEQREKYMEILKDQQDKKKKSNQEIEETKSKIAELDDQIRYFTQDLAKELWGIDIKGWADQLSDALASAFENGENMAKAYKDTVTSIIQQMMQKMMQMAILEPMFERLQKQLFGENGKGGVFDPNNPKGSMSKVTKIIGDYFGKGGEGEKAITASMEFMTAFERAMQNAGLTVLNEASNTLQSSMQGTTEETSGLLAGYVNALRQDVSVNRILLTQYVTQLWPQYIEAYTAQMTSVANIDSNVRIIMEMMQMGNGAMYDRIANISSRIDNIVMGIDRVSIR